MASPTVILNVVIGDLILVTNVDIRAWSFDYDRRSYTMQPGQSVHMPFEAVCVYFGDPRSTGEVAHTTDQQGRDGFVPDRLSEVRRLRQLWQPSDLTPREILPNDPYLLIEGVSDRAPKVTLYTLDGVQLFSVLDDPLGDRVIAANSPTRYDDNYWRQKYEEQEARVQRMEAMLGLAETETAAAPADIAPQPALDIDVDDQPNVPLASLPTDPRDGQLSPTSPLARRQPTPGSPVTRPSALAETPAMAQSARTGAFVVTPPGQPILDPRLLADLPRDA
jgi:hypothetical protein